MSGPLSSPSAAIDEHLERIDAEHVVQRIWDRDPTVWSAEPDTAEIADRLGWLDVASSMRSAVTELREFADVARAEFDRVVLLGMGGSSLAPEVLGRAFGRQPGYPSLVVLDSTHPGAVRAVRDTGELDRTLFIVSSKSGTTEETRSFESYYLHECGGNGAQFVAVTDAGTPLDREATERGYRRVFRNPADIGGRYSALSFVGLVPGSLAGIDVARLLERGERMEAACRASGAARENPGAFLGAVLGASALAGRDKLTLVLEPAWAALGLWIEQLIAESTGKGGRGIVPIVEPALAEAAQYGDDRVFVAVGRQTWLEHAEGVAERLHTIERAGHPVVRLHLEDALGLGAEFFRWEYATAVAGHVLGIHPFNQPNVAESKQNTKRVLSEGGRPRAVTKLRRKDVQQLLGGVRRGDYVAVLAYLPPTPENDGRMDEFARTLRDRLDAPVTWGYGPRYLHSTGQLHKGGPPTGHFIQVIDRPDPELAIPGRRYGFGRLILAQAEGDAEALAKRGRPVLRIRDPEDFMELM